MCSSCNDLKQFKLDELEKSCRQCCVNDENDLAEEGKTVGLIIRKNFLSLVVLEISTSGSSSLLMKIRALCPNRGVHS